MPASAKISLEIPDWWKNLLLPIGILLIVSGLVHFDDLAVSGQKSRSEYHPSATCGFSFAIAAASLNYCLSWFSGLSLLNSWAVRSDCFP
jgi:hypothetical protein